MTKTITIDPITRIEGHARVIIDLADDDTVQSAGLVVNELRGFERIMIGMEADRMPQVTARICGVCPSAHHLAAVKAIENGLDVTIPPAARLMRILFYMGHIIHSHAAHLFALAGPDLFFGVDSNPDQRSIVGMVKENPDFAQKALRVRTIGQKINEHIGGRGIHPVCAVIGGMSWQMKREDCAEMDKLASEALELVLELAEPTKELLFKELDRLPDLKNKLTLPSWYMGTIQDDTLDFYDGILRVRDDTGTTITEFDVVDYEKYMVEKPVGWSYLKPIYFKHSGEEKLYRVSTLARLNCTDSLSTPLAQKEFEVYREQCGYPCHLTIMQIYARLIELIHVCEKAQRICVDPELTRTSRVEIAMKAGRGIGHVEAPRGTLIHDFEFDDQGIVRAANLLVATQHNYAAINETIKQSVEAFVAGKGDAQILNATEFAIRCYDPCLSCATHAWGPMPLQITVRKGNQHRQLQRR